MLVRAARTSRRPVSLNRAAVARSSVRNVPHARPAPAMRMSVFNYATGKVKWFSPTKGYGFITEDGSNKDVFVHHSGIQAEGFRSLNEGDQVQFDIDTRPNGEAAINVVVTNPNPNARRGGMRGGFRGGARGGGRGGRGGAFGNRNNENQQAKNADDLNDLDALDREDVQKTN